MTFITLENVNVSFPIYDGSHRSLRHVVMKATTGGRVAGGAASA